MNFSLLQENYPVLYEYGNGAEIAMYQDLQVYFVKLCCFAEAFVSYVFDELNIVKTEGETLETRLSQSDFMDSMPKEIVSKLQLLQQCGECAVHGDVHVLLGWQTKQSLKDAYLLGRWLFKMFVDSEREYPQYTLPMLSESKEIVETINVKEELERVHKVIGDVHNKIPYTMSQEERKVCNREYLSEGRDVIRQDTVDYEVEETKQSLEEFKSMNRALSAGGDGRLSSDITPDGMPKVDTKSNVVKGPTPATRSALKDVESFAQGVPVDDFIDDKWVQQHVVTPWYALRKEGQGLCRLLVRMLGDRWYKISHITEYDYHIIFTVKGEISHGSYKLYYKKNGTVSSVMQHESMLDEELDEIIMALVGQSIYDRAESMVSQGETYIESRGNYRKKRSVEAVQDVPQGVGSVVNAFTYPRGPVEGIKQYMSWIEEELGQVQIRIARMEKGQFCIRTTFTCGRDVAIFNLYYNRQGIITSTIPLESKSTSVEFIESVLEIINPAQMTYWMST